jgi:hypothetical protein
MFWSSCSPRDASAAAASRRQQQERLLRAIGVEPPACEQQRVAIGSSFTSLTIEVLGPDAGALQIVSLGVD